MRVKSYEVVGNLHHTQPVDHLFITEVGLFVVDSFDLGVDDLLQGGDVYVLDHVHVHGGGQDGPHGVKNLISYFKFGLGEEFCVLDLTEDVEESLDHRSCAERDIEAGDRFLEQGQGFEQVGAVFVFRVVLQQGSHLREQVLRCFQGLILIEGGHRNREILHTALVLEPFDESGVDMQKLVRLVGIVLQNAQKWFQQVATLALGQLEEEPFQQLLQQLPFMRRIPLKPPQKIENLLEHITDDLQILLSVHISVEDQEEHPDQHQLLLPAGIPQHLDAELHQHSLDPDLIRLQGHRQNELFEDVAQSPEGVSR